MQKVGFEALELGFERFGHIAERFDVVRVGPFLTDETRGLQLVQVSADGGCRQVEGRCDLLAVAGAARK